jgi:hypothetical protein
MIRGRGLVPVPGIVPVGDERFGIGDSLLLKRPDGTEVHTTIHGLECLDPNLTNQVVVLLKELAKEDVPNGTEVWSVEGGTAQTPNVDVLPLNYGAPPPPRTADPRRMFMYLLPAAICVGAIIGSWMIEYTFPNGDSRNLSGPM